jgi:hypothetical protein
MENEGKLYTVAIQPVDRCAVIPVRFWRESSASAEYNFRTELDSRLRGNDGGLPIAVTTIVTSHLK